MDSFSDLLDDLLRMEGVDLNCRDSMGRTILHAEAFIDKDMPWFLKAERIRILVALGANVNAADISGMTPLHAVILNDEAEEVQILKAELLVKLGADVNAKFEKEVTSLHRAVLFQCMQAIEVLLSLGVNVNAEKQNNFSTLYTALAKGKIRLAESLVKLGADINSGVNIIIPILQAVESGRLDILKCLAENGADVNWKRPENMTSIMIAIHIKNYEMLERLAALGANMNAKLMMSSVVHEIVKFGRVDMLEFLINTGLDLSPTVINSIEEHHTPLTTAIQQNNLALAEILLCSGADVNQRYNPNVDPLVTALRLGDVAMVKALVKLGANIDQAFSDENFTVLRQAVYIACPGMLKLLIKYGGDINMRYNNIWTLIHDTVARGDIEMVRTLAELGANMNSTRIEGIGLVDIIIHATFQQIIKDPMAKIKVLVEAGIDINRSHNEDVTALHDAVRLGNTKMVQTLCDLGADINCGKDEGLTPLMNAITTDREDIVKLLIRKGADTNVQFLAQVTALHDAVRLGNIEMVDSLIKSGASNAYGKITQFPLNLAIMMFRDLKMVKPLLECGANVNAKKSSHISPLSDAVQFSNTDMIVRTNSQRDTAKQEVITALLESTGRGLYAITEALLMAGADINSTVSIMSPLDQAVIQGNVECVILLLTLGHDHCMQRCESVLQYVCRKGYIDLARLLIIEGSDVNQVNTKGKKPLEYLPFLDTVDYHVLQETSFAEKVEEENHTEYVSVARCQEMTTLLHTPGIGDVHYIPTPSSREIFDHVKHLLETPTQESTMLCWKVKSIGSAAEGTKVGLPNEMDFQLELKMTKHQQRNMTNLWHGYVILQNSVGIDQIKKASTSTDQLPDVMTGSSNFHYKITQQIFDHFERAQTLRKDKNITLEGRDIDIVRATNRKACSLFRVEWTDESTNFIIPVDIVPCLHVDTWPDGATTRTWLMDKHELRSRGYALVPKPPHVDSKLADQFTEEELQTSWKISFPHLETEHMQRLEQRIKDVYLTAKCLRNPDVCQILILEEGKLPRPADKYITSYQLKMCFFQNVEHFRQTDLSLEEMVCKVYSDLEDGLTKGFIPLFFLPKVNALGGIDLDVPKCAKVARIMARFVRGLYLRDCRSDTCTFSNDEDQEVIVYQRKHSSVYNTYRL